ncbi:hypothetical protein CR203_10865 [Salipaludibacillus neizhouensis]|uniref:YkoP-like domain-containing protein n=1 Tax=Salipaludibacillus neizhouensis TaxID=885475 RepID=A0A3A9KH83_9BACI|nr:hypothetical protein [Salipaludibacillus neizhouensis]RKL67015.1 hypothetical protein CR203_10865 [Salipaludibacillus neizhouensis]
MRSYLISIWSLIDPLYYFCTRLTFPPSKGRERNIFRIRLTKYKGKSIVLSDGTKINKNDTLVKIHFHNVRLLSELKDIKSEFKKAKIISSYVKKSLPGVEIYIQNYCNSDEIKGIIGITLLNKGCERLGFEIIDIKHPIYKLFKRLSFLPIGFLSSKNSSISHILMHQAPSYLFMSRIKLSNMYKL